MRYKQKQLARIRNGSGEVVIVVKKPKPAMQLLPGMQKLAHSVHGELRVQAKELAKHLEQ